MTQKLAIHGGTPVRTRPYPSWPMAGPREEELLRQVLSSTQWGGNSPLVGEFERVFAGMHDCAYGVAAANGSVALEMALFAAGIGEGDEVIVPAHSFIATATAVSLLGAIPVFVDIDRATYNLDLTKVESAISESTKAILPVHFGGAMVDMDQLESLASRHKLTVIEDAAHAHGAEWNGRRAGSFGAGAVFSFQNSKVMTAGEGGIVVTNDQEFAARARSFANCGRKEGHGWFEHFELTSNYRLSGLQAAVLLAQLERLVDQILLRRQNADTFRNALKTPGIAFQQAPKKADVHSLYLLVGRVDEKVFGVNRDEFVQAMQAEGVPCSPFYPHPLYENPLYKSHPFRALGCPVAEGACRDSFWLHLRVLMGGEEDTLDIARAIAKIHDIFKPVATEKIQ
jgi:dTDP-4-amino-4,6-dideoxygalactose transaminase